MYPISNGYKNVIYSGDARHKLKLLFNGVEYQSANSKVESVKRTSKILSDGGERFSLDNFKAQELEIVINDIDLEDIIEPVSVSIGTLVNNAYEYVPIGIFNLNEKPQTNSGKTTIKLIDNAVKFDVPYNAQDIIEENGGEASLLQILQDICTKCEVTLSTTDFVNKDTKVSVWDNSINARQYVMYIAEIAGRIATINRSGELELIDLQKGSDIEVEINNPTEINNVLPRPINGLQLKGNTYQQTYTGKNLMGIQVPSSTNLGVTFKLENGILSLNGTTSGAGVIYLNKNNTISLHAGTYKISTQVESGSFTANSKDTAIYLKRKSNDSSVINLYKGNNYVSSSSFTLTEDTDIYFHIYTNGSGFKFNNLNILMQLESGSTATNWEPYVGGTASPNPDYPQSIENVTGLQTIEVVGKNLFDKTKITENTSIRNDNGATYSNNDSFSTDYINVNNQTNIAVSGMSNATGYLWGAFYDKDKSYVSGFTNNNNNHIVNIPNNAYYIRLGINNSDLNTLMINYGDELLPYEEYKGQKYNINLGKNLFDKDNANTLTAFIYNNTTTINSTSAGLKLLYIPIIGGKTYTISKVSSLVFRVATSINTPAIGVSCTNAIVDETATHITITTPTTANYLLVNYYRGISPADTLTEQEILDSIQIEVGSQATSYSEYFTPIKLNKIGNYQDRIYKQNNKWYIEKKIGKAIIDGTQGTFSTPSTNRFNIDDVITNYKKIENSNLSLSNYYESYNQVNANAQFNTLVENVNYGFDFSSSLSSYTFRIKDTRFTSINDFKTWLSNNPVEVDYVLNEPEIEEITNTDLIEQLESIELLKGYNYVSIYSDNLVGGLSINYQSERQPIELDSWLFEKYTVGDKLKISRVVYEDAIRKFEHGDESEGTLYINSANPYIINQDEIDNTYSIINDLEMYSMNITKMIGNPAIDPWDMLEFEYNDNKYQFLGQNTLNYRGTIIQSFNTQIGSNAKSQENVTINAEDSKFKRIFTRIDQAEGNIELNTSQITNVQGDLEQNYYTKEQANILIQNAETGVTNTFSEAGGNNIFRNTGLWFADDKVTEYIYPSSTTYPSSDLYPLSQQHYEFWDGYVEKIKNDNSSNLSSMLLKNGYVQQKQTVPNGNYTVSFKYKKLINVATCKVFINGVEYPLTQTTDTEFVTGYKDTEGHYVTQPLEVSNREIMVKFYTDADNACEIYDLMVNAGTVKLAYSQNQNETKTDTVNISKGITITSTDTDTIFKANADGIRTLNQNNNVLTEFTDTGMKTKKMEVNEEAQICGTLIKEVANQTWFTKL